MLVKRLCIPHITNTDFKSIIEMHRNKRGASTKDLSQAAALLIAAAGVKLPPSLNVTAEATSNISTDAANSQYFSGLQFVGQTNVPALKELARVYEAGMPAAVSAMHAKHTAGWNIQIVSFICYSSHVFFVDAIDLHA